MSTNKHWVFFLPLYLFMPVKKALKPKSDYLKVLSMEQKISNICAVFHSHVLKNQYFYFLRVRDNQALKIPYLL